MGSRSKGFDDPTPARRSAIGCVCMPCAAQRSGVPVIQIYDSVKGHPIPGARVTAYGVYSHDTTRAKADSDGTVRISAWTPGPYVVHTSALGYWWRVDTLTLDPDQHRRIGLLVVFICPGRCPLNPYRIAAARAGRAAWSCTTDTIEVAARRAWWISQLDYLSVKGVKLAVGRKPRLVHDRAICRRVAAALDRASLLVERATTVFRCQGYWLVSQTGEAPFILSKRYRIVYDIRGE